MNLDPRGSGVMSFPPRIIDPPYAPAYPPHFAHNPAGPMPYLGNEPTGPYVHRPNMPPAKIESINDLLSSDAPDFVYCEALSTFLHPNKCQECLQFGLHIIMPTHRTKFLSVVTAHSEASLAPLCAKVDKLTKEAQTTAKTLGELKDALESSQKLVVSLRAQREKAESNLDEISMENRTNLHKLQDVERQLEAASSRRPRSPVRLIRSPPSSLTSTRATTPYERPGSHRAAQPASRHPHTRAPIVMEPSSEGDIIMASLPANIRPPRMHDIQPRFRNPRPCPTVDFRWKADSGTEMVGLPKTPAGTPYLPDKVGLAWLTLEKDVTGIDAVYHRIDLLFRNRKEEIWLAATRSVFEFRRLITPLPEVMKHFIRLHHLRKNVWTYINKGVANNADVSIVSPGCRLRTGGYAGLYTPDVSLWAVIHTATDVDSNKLSTRTGRTTTAADLKRMFKDAICSGNFFEITPEELANGRYELPRLAHYDGPLEMNSIVEWLRKEIGMTPFMVHAHFRPFLRRSFESSPGDHHLEFSPDRFYPDECMAPDSNDSLPDFPEDRDWNPSRGPRGHLIRPIHFTERSTCGEFHLLW